MERKLPVILAVDVVGYSAGTWSLTKPARSSG